MSVGLTTEAALIPTSSGLAAVVDKEDAPRVALHTWRVCKTGRKFYVYAEIDGRQVTLHRFIFGDPGEGFVVDHRNGVTVDCRRSNLRRATPTQNAQNAIVKSSSSTGLKGVCLHKKNGKFQARIRVHGERLSLGYFDTADEAGLAYASAEKIHFGEFAHVAH